MSRVAKKRLAAVRAVQAAVAAGPAHEREPAARRGRRCEHRPQDRGRHTEVPAHDKTHGVPWAHGGSGVHTAHRTCERARGWMP